MNDVAIFGAGIGGLTAAIALARRGIDAHVYEAAPELRAVGAGIWVPTNAMQVLAELGVAKDVLARGLELEGIELHHMREPLQKTALAPVKERFGFSTVSIHRARLQAALAAHVKNLHLGARCAEISEDGAVLEDGTRVRARVIVGADGLRSRARAFVDPESALVYSGQTCYRGVAEIEIAQPARCAETWGSELRFGYSAIGPREVYWFAPMVAPERAPDRAGELGELYADFPSPIPEIVRATPRERILCTELWEIGALARWSRANVALLGDAAHAMTPNLGQGGAQAIEDAWVLAHALHTHADVREALEAYESQRRPRAESIATMARRIGRAAHLGDGVIAAARDFALKHAPEWLTKSSLDDLYRVPFLPA